MRYLLRFLPAVVSLCLLGMGSPVFGQTLGTPSPSSPSNGATGESTSVTLTWSGVSLATSYELQVAASSSFSNVIIDQTQSGTSYTVSGLASGTTYYWRVRASTLLLTGGWSATWSFSTAPSVSVPAAPSLSSPSNGSTGEPVSLTLTWAASSGASSYNVQVSTDNSFSTIVTSSTGVSGTSQQISGLANGTTYYWRVQAVNSAGTSSWSGAWTFATQSGASAPSAPTLASPSNGSTNEPTSLVITWNSVSGASKYWLQVSKDQAFTNIVFGDSTITSTSQQVTYLSPSTT